MGHLSSARRLPCSVPVQVATTATPIRQGSTLDGLTPEQETKLQALLAALEQLPTPELILESARLRTPLIEGNVDEAAKKRMRFAIEGGFAAQKVLAYIAVLRSIDEQRIANNRDIRVLDQQAALLRRTNPLAAVEPSLLAVHKAGEQEVYLHFLPSVPPASPHSCQSPQGQLATKSQGPTPTCLPRTGRFGTTTSITRIDFRAERAITSR